jgi:hypothetical protein
MWRRRLPQPFLGIECLDPPFSTRASALDLYYYSIRACTQLTSDQERPQRRAIGADTSRRMSFFVTDWTTRPSTSSVRRPQLPWPCVPPKEGPWLVALVTLAPTPRSVITIRTFRLFQPLTLAPCIAYQPLSIVSMTYACRRKVWFGN